MAGGFGAGVGANGPGGGLGGTGSGANGDGGGEDAGAGSGQPPPVCDPCPCSTGPFGEPVLVQGLGVGSNAFGPAPSVDGSTLYFSAVDEDENIFFATRSTRGNLFSVAALVPGVNGPDEDGTPFITADDRSLYFFSTRVDADAPGGRDLWQATRASAGAAFSAPVVVPGINTDGLEHLPRLTLDGLTLMFVSGRPSTSLGSNIWESRRASPTSPWAEPVELPGVNSNSRDEGFWLSADGLTVFFASNRAGEFEDMDIFVATRPDLESAFGAASGLDGVNTAGIELDPAVTTDGFELFFASDRSGTMQLYRSARLCP